MSELGAADEIAKLAELRERGLLSDKEFEKQRRRVLGGTQNRFKLAPGVLSVVGVLVVVVCASASARSGSP